MTWTFQRILIVLSQLVGTKARAVFSIRMGRLTRISAASRCRNSDTALCGRIRLIGKTCWLSGFVPMLFHRFRDCRWSGTKNAQRPTTFLSRIKNP
jgi:hypothetical protein